MRIAIVINPISGRRGGDDTSGRQRLAVARRLTDGTKIEAEIVLTTAKGHGEALAREYVAKHVDIVIAWGGDGTANEIAGPLIGTSTALGLIPSGSGDGLARSLGLQLDAAAAFASAVSGSVSDVDVGYLAGRHFVNVAGVGFDAAVARDFNLRGRRGAVQYVLRSLSLVWSYRAARYQLTLDEQAREGAYFLVAFANGREYGNRLVLAPDANGQDGWLDAVLVEGGSPWRQIWRSRRLAIGPSRPAEGITRTRIRTATVRGDQLVCHVDGETFEARGAVDVRLAPRALRIAGLAAPTQSPT
jgi:diacylglycerol kinase (ATP)